MVPLTYYRYIRPLVHYLHRNVWQIPIYGLCILAATSFWWRGQPARQRIVDAHPAGRFVVVGDVHGCSAELQALLATVNFLPGVDELIMVGDLIGKGPNPKEVIRIVREMNGKAIQGNHEFNLLKWKRRGAPLPDPLEKIKDAYAATVAELDEADWEWLASLPYVLRLELPSSAGTVLVVHAGLAPGTPLDQQKPGVMVHIRNIDGEGQPTSDFDAGTAWAKSWNGPEQVIFGHDAKRGLQKESFAVGLDTGAVYGGALTALVIPRNQASPVIPAESHAFVSVPAKKEYAPKDKK